MYRIRSIDDLGIERPSCPTWSAAAWDRAKTIRISNAAHPNVRCRVTLYRGEAARICGCADILKTVGAACKASRFASFSRHKDYLAFSSRLLLCIDHETFSAWKPS